VKALSARWPLLVVIIAAALIAWIVISGSGGDAEPATTSVPVTTTTSVALDTTTSTIPAGFTPEFEPGRCRFDPPPGRDVECGWVTVPENRSDPSNNRAIRLHVAVFRSDAVFPEPDPIVYLSGGPGGEELETIGFAFEDSFAPFLENRDFIMFDQRGVGYSEPALACPQVLAASLDMLDDDLSDEEAFQRQLAAYEECRDSLVAAGVDLSAFNTAENAADVADLRVALGYEEWNLLGISYGTRLALTVMRDHPDGIRSVVLDSAYPPQVDGIAEAPANARRAFDVLFASCAADAACAAAFPDLETTLWEQVDRLNDSPILLPIVYFDGRRFDALINGDALAGVVFQALYSAEVIPLLPELITDVAAGDYLDLATLVSNYVSISEFVSFGMHTSVQCREDIAFADPETVASAVAAYPQVGQIFAEDSGFGTYAFDLCEAWGAGAAGPVEDEAVFSGIPTMVVAGEFDPITPPEWGREAAATLSAASFFEFPGLGHGASVSDDCPQRMVLDFINEPDEVPDDSCIAAMTAPDFVAGSNDGDGPLVLEPFTSEQFGLEIRGVVPSGWEDTGFGVFARGASPLDQTSIVIQGIAPGTADFTLNLVASQLGIDGELEARGGLVAGSYSWTLWQTNVQGYVADIAVADGDPAGVLVLLLTSEGERDELYETVFLPVLEAAEAG
jgi:pimeloyl-ACP methyl ester carboxylesterase